MEILVFLYYNKLISEKKEVLMVFRNIKRSEIYYFEFVPI